MSSSMDKIGTGSSMDNVTLFPLLILGPWALERPPRTLLDDVLRGPRLFPPGDVRVRRPPAARHQLDRGEPDDPCQLLPPDAAPDIPPVPQAADCHDAQVSAPPPGGAVVAGRHGRGHGVQAHHTRGGRRLAESRRGQEAHLVLGQGVLRLDKAPAGEQAGGQDCHCSCWAGKHFFLLIPCVRRIAIERVASLYRLVRCFWNHCLAGRSRSRWSDTSFIWFYFAIPWQCVCVCSPWGLFYGASWNGSFVMTNCVWRCTK